MDTMSIVILVLVIFLMLWGITRLRSHKTTPRLQIAMEIISNVNDNLKLLAEWQTGKQSRKKFKTNSWKAYSDKLDFLEPETATAIKDSFNLLTDFNNRIEAVQKSNSHNELKDLPFETLKEPLSNSRKGLAQWIQTNMNSEIWRSRGLFGW